MTDYELSRRDAIAALTAAGIGVSAGGVLTWDYLTDGDERPPDVTLSDDDRATLDALAETVYPSEVSGIPAFVESYVVGRLDDHPDREAEMVYAIEELDSYAEEWHDRPFRDLDAGERDDTLDMMGLDVTDPDPDGNGAERIRFYLLNELLFALYASPTGGELLGLENPQGYPGGTDSYQQGPP
ncbi:MULTISPECIES: gluconate 2-dehydrogenase subunit 3 family protein [Salinibaculum]|uniref:gluconate 2-dehydrogenase subunit 3 family protein n=1 Tax=Salinibaculum TaxID=2732368 RepID=UPI0030D101AB